MITFTCSNQLAMAKWKSIETIKPPIVAAVILENRCQKEGFRYLLLAGILKG